MELNPRNSCGLRVTEVAVPIQKQSTLRWWDLRQPYAGQQSMQVLHSQHTPPAHSYSLD